jgi:hypothetical protein
MGNKNIYVDKKNISLIYIKVLIFFFYLFIFLI